MVPTMKSLLFALLLITSCSHPKPAEESKLTHFVNEWSQEYSTKDSAYNQTYIDYLKSVSLLFKDQDSKLDLYLSTIRNNFQIIAHNENTLENKYWLHKRRRAKYYISDYKSYKAKELSSLSERLEHEREEKLKKELGEELFVKLKENHQNFILQHQITSSKLPL